MAPVIEGLGDDFEELTDLLAPLARAIMAGGGYPPSPLALTAT
jgi:hypothetical protein